MELRTPHTFVDVFTQRADELSGRAAFSFLSDINSGQIDCVITYGELHREALAIAGWLTPRVSPGGRALLLFPPGLDFIKGFLGCLYAGVVAVPAPLPEGFQAQEDRVNGILQDAAASAVLTDAKSLPGVEAWLARQADTQAACGAVGMLGEIDIDTLELPKIFPETLALLQYTSGSTGDPKGVMITHRNLLDNVEQIRQCVGGGPQTRGCGWLPLIHDMGLMGQVLWISYVGGWCLLMPPTEFLRRPYRWLEIIDSFDIDTTAAPNFAYDLCSRTVTEERIAGLDLSRWKVTFNGAEPVQAETLEKFAVRFASAGFQAETFVPCYGMAEATLFVCGTAKGIAPTVTAVDPTELAAGRLTQDTRGSGRKLVSSGPIDPLNVRIVDPHTGMTLPAGGVGEIWIRGLSIAQGYWQRDELNKETFERKIADETGFLRTGDLGATHDGELYVTGRLKEVIIIRGRNLYPQDLERTVAGLHDALALGAGAIFSLPDHADAVVAIHEIKPRGLSQNDLQDITESIRRTLVQKFSIGVPSVVLVRPGSIRKTTSGKVRRSLMRQLFLESSLAAIHQDLTDSVRLN